jgi:light-regulated signal transduction histidine kinase (bacteriophytochrome)
MSKESIDPLRAECDRLAAALADRSAQLEAVSKEFDQFTQTVSHDLRAPLRAMEGFAQILLEDYREKLDADGKRCVETLASSAHKASLLLEDLSTYSRLSRKPFQPLVINMEKLAAQKAEDLKMEGAKTKFSIAPLPEAWADPEMIDTIVGQLLANAVKFTSRQKNPCVEITGRRDNGNTIYAVCDNGVGFDPKYASRLFGVFQRLHDEKEFAGRGIGLATVQRLVHRHGGKVWAEGKTDAGAAFFFSLPVRPL